MKIAYCSDLHLEFGNLQLKNTENAEVLILAGDILVAQDIEEYVPNKLEGFIEFRSERFHDFMRSAAEVFPHIIYIMGNHEHYHGDYAKTFKKIKSAFAYLPNVHVMERELLKIGDVSFICGTMWTDMNEGDNITLMHMKDMMNEFRCVLNTNSSVSYKVFLPDPDNPGKEITQFKTRAGKFTPEDAMFEFRQFKQYVQVCTDYLGENPGKFVVVSHHAPSFRSIHSDYVNDTIMNGGYASSLDEFIEDKTCIKAWIHGHIHQSQDYMIGETRILANPRGYAGHEDCAREFQLKYFEV